jgi:hypothetical protein
MRRVARLPVLMLAARRWLFGQASASAAQLSRTHKESFFGSSDKNLNILDRAT